MDNPESPREVTPTASQQNNVKKKSVPTFVMVLAFVFVAGVGYVAGGINSGTFSGNINTLLGREDINLSSVQATYRALADNFDGEIDQQKLIEGANKGLVDAVEDQYTVFMNRKESTSFDNALTGNIGGGIGVELGIRNNVPTVLRVLKDNPAEKAGIAVNDIIYKVNGDEVKGKTIDEIVSKIRGDVGTTVKLSVIRSGEEKQFDITREQVNNPSAYGTVTDNIGVMTITRFDDQTGNLARAVAADFKKQNVKGVVLDLRGNGGGYVTAAQSVAGIWLDKQVVTTERRSGKVTDELLSTGSQLLRGIPTVVLVNQSSASASEIVAGALRDHGVATLLGETTFGKGSVQKLVNLIDGATLKVTVARWYTPKGVNISEKGIVPDVVVSRSADDINAGRDPQLSTALERL